MDGERETCNVKNVIFVKIIIIFALSLVINLFLHLFMYLR